MSISLDLATREKLTKSYIINARKTMVYGGLTDGEFLSGLAFGVSYKVAFAGHVPIHKRGLGNTRLNPDAATVEGQYVMIDQEDIFNVILNNADAKQGIATIGAYAEQGAYDFADEFDQYLAGQITAGANINGAEYGIDGTPISIDESNVVDYTTLLVEKFLENNGRAAGASLVMPAFMGLLLQNARAGAGSEIGANEQALGIIDRIHGVNIASSNNTGVGATSGKCVHIFEKRAIKWRDSMDPIWVGYHPDYMSDVAQGKHIYGGAVVLGDIVGVGYVEKA